MFTPAEEVALWKATYQTLAVLTSDPAEGLSQLPPQQGPCPRA